MKGNEVEAWRERRGNVKDKGKLIKGEEEPEVRFKGKTIKESGKGK